MDKSKKEVKKVVDNTQQQPKQNDIFILDITLNDKSVESYDNVIHIVPVQNLNLLAITLSNGETIVYPINDNIKKYSFRVKGEK